MKYELLFSATAAEDLKEIACDIYSVSGSKESALKYIEGIREECRALELFPESGALPKDRILLSAGYRFVVYKGYLAFYKVDDENRRVIVSAVFNGKRDYSRYMNKYL